MRGISADISIGAVWGSAHCEILVKVSLQYTARHYDINQQPIQQCLTLHMNSTHLRQSTEQSCCAA